MFTPRRKMTLAVVGLSVALGIAAASGEWLQLFAQAKKAQPAGSSAKASAGTLDRTVLPIHEPPTKAITTLDARDAKAPPRFEVKPPQGAPTS